MIAERLCSTARLFIKKKEQKKKKNVAFHYCFPRWKIRSTEWVSAERMRVSEGTSRCQQSAQSPWLWFCSRSVEFCPMLHVCQLSLSHSLASCPPLPSQTQKEEFVKPSPRRNTSLLSSAAVSSSFLLCALFQKVKNMTPAIGGWNSARETQMSGARKVQPVVSSF